MATATDQAKSSYRTALYIRLGIPILMITAAVGFGAWWLHQTVQVEDIRRLEWRDLETTDAVLKAGDSLQTAWLGGAYVSNNAIKQVIKLQEGTILKVIGMKQFEDLEVKVNDFELISREGPARVEVGLDAKSEKNKLFISIKVKALLGYKRSTPADADNEAKAYLGLSVTELQPRLSWAGISMAAPEFMRTLSASGLMKVLGDSLEFPMPLAKSLEIPLGLPKNDGRAANAEKEITIPIVETGGFVKMKAVYANTDLTYLLTFATPLFTKSGLWLLANDKPFALPAPTDAVPTETELKTFADAVNAKRNAIPVPKGDVAVFINGKTITSLVKKVQELPIEKRSVVLKSVGFDKQLYNKPWHDNVLGSGGFYVEARKPDFASGLVVIDVPTVAWMPSKGVQFSGNATATGTVNMHWHFNATGYLGGGVGKDLNIAGKGLVGVNGLLGISMIDLGGKPVAVFMPTMNCVNVPLEAQENGELHVKVQTSVPMFDKPLGLAPALDTVPRRISLADKDAKNKKAVTPEADVIVVEPAWKNPALDITLTPVEAMATETGFWISANFSTAVASADSNMYKAAKDLLAQQIKDYSEALPKPVCPTADGLRITILGVEIGPNGELMKLFLAGGQLVKNITAAAQKALDDIGREAAKAAAQTAAEAQKIAQQAARDAQNAVDYIGARLGVKW